MTLTKKLMLPGILALSLAAPAMAQTAATDWDTDADGSLSNEEFNTGFGGAATFSNYDSDGDGMLSEDEYNAASEGMTERWGERDYEMGAFSDADANADGMLDEDEYNNGWFNTYDADQSGVIEEPELGDVGDDIGDGGLFDI